LNQQTIPIRKKPTVKNLFELKGKRQLTQVFVENIDEARASEEAGIDMGAGPQDVQYLFAYDILGTHNGHYPRHARKYCDLHSERIVPIKDEEFEKFMNAVDLR
jgi:ketopantoate hydroxymethyltransferase